MPEHNEGYQSSEEEAKKDNPSPAEIRAMRTMQEPLGVLLPRESSPEQKLKEKRLLAELREMGEDEYNKQRSEFARRLADIVSKEIPKLESRQVYGTALTYNTSQLQSSLTKITQLEEMSIGEIPENHLRIELLGFDVATDPDSDDKEEFTRSFAIPEAIYIPALLNEKDKDSLLMLELHDRLEEIIEDYTETRAYLKEYGFDADLPAFWPGKHENIEA